MITSDGQMIDADSLPREFNDVKQTAPTKKTPRKTALKDMMAEHEASIIISSYNDLGSSYKVAEELGISQSQASKKIRKYCGMNERN